MLCKALQEGNNAKLEVLRLQFNEIDAKGVKGLADAHEKLPALRRVELNGNRFNEDDEGVEKLREVLEVRKEKANGVGEDDEEYWGLDELDELEDESDEEEEEGAESGDEEGVEVEEKAAREVAAAQQAEEENVPLENDKSVNDLADALEKTQIK